MFDSKKRSMVKTLTWRVTATVTTIIIVYYITGKVSWALTIGGIEFFAKIIIYYFHERAWEKVKFGRSKPPDYNI